MLVPSRPLCFSVIQSNEPTKGLIIPASWGTWVGVGFELRLPTRAHTQHTHAHICPPAYMCMCVQARTHMRTCTYMPAMPSAGTSIQDHGSDNMQGCALFRRTSSWDGTAWTVLAQPEAAWSSAPSLPHVCEDTLHAPGRGTAVTTTCGWATPSER